MELELPELFIENARRATDVEHLSIYHRVRSYRATEYESLNLMWPHEGLLPLVMSLNRLLKSLRHIKLLSVTSYGWEMPLAESMHHRKPGFNSFWTCFRRLPRWKYDPLQPVQGCGNYIYYLYR